MSVPTISEDQKIYNRRYLQAKFHQVQKALNHWTEDDLDFFKKLELDLGIYWDKQPLPVKAGMSPQERFKALDELRTNIRQALFQNTLEGQFSGEKEIYAIEIEREKHAQALKELIHSGFHEVSGIADTITTDELRKKIAILDRELNIAAKKLIDYIIHIGSTTEHAELLKPKAGYVPLGATGENLRTDQEPKPVRQSNKVGSEPIGATGPRKSSQQNADAAAGHWPSTTTPQFQAKREQPTPEKESSLREENAPSDNKPERPKR